LEPDVKVHSISLGPIAKKIDSKAEFEEALWEGHIDATLKAISELRFEIVDILQQLQPVMRRGCDVIGQDGPMAEESTDSVLCWRCWQYTKCFLPRPSLT